VKKGSIRWMICLAVLLVLYIVIAFAVPFVHTATFWLSFVFTLVAFAVVAASIYIAFIKSPDAKSKFYGFPIAKIGTIYGIVQLILGFIFMALAVWAPAWLAVILFIIALGAAVIGLISADAVVEEIQKQDVKLKKDVALMRELQSKVNGIVGLCGDDIRAEVSALAEDFKFSDPVSSEALAEIETELATCVDELQTALVDGDAAAARELCRKVKTTLAERNRLCKLNKN